MKIGLTYDLRQDYLAEGYSEDETAEFDRPDTIDAIEKTLNHLGFETERIGNLKSLMRNLVSGYRWDLVFNICEGLYGMGREAQVPAILDAYGIPYVFSDPLVLSLTLHKGMTKRVIRDLGIPTPDFFVVEENSQIQEISLPYPLFAKPVAEGTGKGINATSKIRNSDELNRVCRDLLQKYRQPVLVETFLPGREFTVGIAGTGNQAEVLGTMEVILNDRAEAEVYSYVNKEFCEDRVDYRLADPHAASLCRETALRAWRGLGCRDGGRIDLRMDENGVPHFLEVNPLAGIHPEHSDLPIICHLKGIPYQTLLEKIMNSALNRYGMKQS